MTPAATLFCFAALGALLSALSLVVALQQPQLDLPRGAIPLQINDLSYEDSDRYEEPDQLGSYAAIQRFNARQGAFRAQLEQDEVTLRYALPDGTERTETLTPRPRTLADLPFLFWFQNWVSMFSILIGGWVLGLRPQDWGARFFAGTTLFLPLAALSAAVYSTRQIGLNETLFYTLSSLNATGSIGFGICLVAMFSQYPRSLYRPIWNLIPLVVFGTAIALIVAQTGPDNLIGYAILTELAISMLLGVVQWVKTRRDPVNRAGLRWFILVTLTACSLFVMISSAPLTLGFTDRGLISQGLAFGFFNIMHVGLALGVLRFKVFNLDRWSYYIWLWLSGMVMIFALDVLLIRFLQDQPWVTLSTALLIAGFLYFPLRQLLLKLLLQRRSARVTGRMGEIVSVALSPTQALRAHRWEALLTDVFKPLAPPMALLDVPEHPRLRENGLSLDIPGVDDLRPMRLRYAFSGRRLFTPQDLEIASTLIQTYRLAADGRTAYERGTVLERDRISRDIHDNIGAQLLSALHSPDAGRKDDLLRDSLNDLRAIINDGFQEEYPLDSILVDLRLETVERVEAQGLHVTWQDRTAAADTLVSFEVVNGVRSILREAVSNVLRHAQASQVTVALTQSDSALRVVVEDDGIGPPADVAGGQGNGLPNIVERASQLAGHARIEARAQGGTRVSVTLPLVPAQQRERAAQ
ncbi:hypothetical protein KDD17_02485 [Sulfitobacter albidus]|uniref:histidine kinase n=1 Tax=Sulfitobacter albidus TaxID=2829501 RepID=A0A975PN00_9RHOB|nr:ATP-binding protein [Sulfitobacter albidus]QUJ76941.1 hypothetical protein KDD17_02485 [Sulfitobacter albidus]